MKRLCLGSGVGGGRQGAGLGGRGPEEQLGDDLLPGSPWVSPSQRERMQEDVEGEVSVPHSGLDAMLNAPTPSSLLFTSLAWDPDVDGPNAAQ